jgi:large subunit ribosomal protein L4
MEIPVVNQRGQAAGSVEVDDSIFDVPMNHALVHQLVVAYQANKRQGTHDTKTRGEVSGGGRKPWIQKHTGRARQGSIRSPQWRHGGTVFGPHPRDYRQDMPKRMRRQALKCAISEKLRQGSVVCVDSLDTLDGKTRSMASLLDALSISNSVLVVTEDSDTNAVRSGRNLKQVWTLPVNQLNAHELLRRSTILITREAVTKGQALWAATPHRRPAAVRAGAGEEEA